MLPVLCVELVKGHLSPILPHKYVILLLDAQVVLICYGLDLAQQIRGYSFHGVAAVYQPHKYLSIVLAAVINQLPENLVLLLHHLLIVLEESYFDSLVRRSQNLDELSLRHLFDLEQDGDD